MPSRVKLLASFLFLLLFSSPSFSQDWIHSGTGIGVDKPRIAVSDFAPRSDSDKSHAVLFTSVVRDDLAFSGILELASPSFYPPKAPSQPAELQPSGSLDKNGFAMLDWAQPPVNANFLA